MHCAQYACRICHESTSAQTSWPGNHSNFSQRYAFLLKETNLSDYDEKDPARVWNFCLITDLLVPDFIHPAGCFARVRGG